MDFREHPWLSADFAARAGQLLDSFERQLGRPLLATPSGATEQERSRLLYQAPQVVVAHGTEPDPRLDFANAAAVKLWDATLEQLLGMPSRLTAEPAHRDERAEMLERTTRDGYIDDYHGIRITATGRRFEILRAVVWNVTGSGGERLGQAATFTDWEWLEH